MSEFKFLRKEESLFWYWINERHAIYLKKEAGKPRPWTKDKILDTYKFTNPFRQLDRVTQEWIRRYIFLYGSKKRPTAGEVLFHNAMFRLFNWPKTYDRIFFSGKWSKRRTLKILDKMKDAGEQIFTGAYIVPNLGLSIPKTEVITDAVHYVWKNRDDLAERIMAAKSMKITVEILQEINSVGAFIGYEMACDLRFTFVLHDARDTLIWANPGPGAKRGINRMLFGKPKIKGRKPDYVAAMHALLKRAPKKLRGYVRRCEWPFEMREIEHSLCEFDKYRRVQNGEGRPRSRYRQTELSWQRKQDIRYGKKISVKELLKGKT